MGWLMGANSDRVSTMDYSRYEDTNTNWVVLEGLGALLAHAGRDLDIRLNTAVDRIESRADGLRVHGNAGVIECKAVIVTVPTTVLAEQRVRFDPPLPDAFNEAFAGVPLGVANKVFFEFKPNALPFEGMYHFTGTDQTARTASYGVRPGGQELLLAFFGGALAQELELRGELEAFARDELSGIFGSHITVDIVRSRTTAWFGDPWSRGSYSAALPGHSHGRAVLNTSPRSGLHFAGEACSIHHFGTIHGAWESAVRAATQAATDLR
jgi:monoamine oxidase